MKSRLGKVLISLWTAILLLPAAAFAAGGGGAAPIVIVADTRKFTGCEAWWTNLYNESHIYFTLLTIAIIPLVGIVLGVFTDFIMSHIGIDLKSRELAEH